MDSKEVRSLMKAYSKVYDSQEINEAITSEKGKAKAAEMIANRSTPSGRAKSGKGANVAQIRQIHGSGRGRFDREGLGGTPMTPTMAKNPIKKQNYDGTGNKAARRAGTYREYDVNEALTGGRYKKVMKKPGGTAYSRMVSADPSKRATRGGRGGESDFGAGDRGSGNKAARRAGTYREYDVNEALDIFDVVLEFLQVEGYAETLEEAEWMMANELDAEDIKAIIETRMDPRGRPSSGPMNVYAKNKPNTDPKFQAALQAVRDADAKKTPEQRQKELDAYKARQANR